jgi:hypothetical protein
MLLKFSARGGTRVCFVCYSGTSEKEAGKALIQIIAMFRDTS